MAEPEEIEQEGQTKRSKKPLLIGLILAVLLGGGGFYAVWSGMVLAPAEHSEEMAEEPMQPLPDVAFVSVQPLVVNIGTGASARHLRFSAQLEVRKEAEEEVIQMLPRVVDVFNGYLRAVEVAELEHKAALVRLRAQMLRRVQIVTGEGRVRDLLIMEFVMN